MEEQSCGCVGPLVHGLDHELLAKVGHPDGQELIDEAAKDFEVKIMGSVHGLRRNCEELNGRGKLKTPANRVSMLCVIRCPEMRFQNFALDHCFIYKPSDDSKL